MSDEKIDVMTAKPGGECHIRVWCQECKRNDYVTSGDKYLCSSCGKIMELDHEVGHDVFPHVRGDYQKLH